MYHGSQRFSSAPKKNKDAGRLAVFGWSNPRNRQGLESFLRVLVHRCLVENNPVTGTHEILCRVHSLPLRTISDTANPMSFHQITTGGSPKQQDSVRIAHAVFFMMRLMSRAGCWIIMKQADYPGPRCSPFHQEQNLSSWSQ
jgi:hypothetical protein